MLWLSDTEVRTAFDQRVVGDALELAFHCHAEGRYVQPKKPYLRPKGREGEYYGGRFISMPAYLGSPFDVAGIKWIAGFPSNVEQQLPRASGVLVLSSAVTGVTFSIMDCSFVSAFRTAWVAARAFGLLAPRTAGRLAVLGAGPIASSILSQLLVTGSLSFWHVRIHDPRQERARALAVTCGSAAASTVDVCESVAACVEDAAVVITATTGAAGYLTPRILPSAALIIAISLEDCSPEVILTADKIIVDDVEQCDHDEKPLSRLIRDGRLGADDIYADLGELIAGRKPGREAEHELIYVNPMGMAIEDIAAGMAVYCLAQRRGIGQLLE